MVMVAALTAATAVTASVAVAVVAAVAEIMVVVVATIVSVVVGNKLQGCFACRLLACWRLAPWLAGLLA